MAEANKVCGIVASVTLTGRSDYMVDVALQFDDPPPPHTYRPDHYDVALKGDDCVVILNGEELDASRLGELFMVLASERAVRATLYPDPMHYEMVLRSEWQTVGA
jgi:hypothetical protein